MSKLDLRKNRLDLEYKFESQRAIICFTAMILTALGILGTMIAKEKYLIGVGSSLIFIIYSGLFYRSVKKKADKILNDIENL